MSGIVGSRFNIKGSGLVSSLGTDGQVFTSAGAGKSHVFEDAAGGAWTKIESQTVSDDSEIDFETLSTDYRDFRIIGSAIEETANAQFVNCRVYIGSWITSGYWYAMHSWNSGGAQEQASSTSDSIMKTHGVGFGNATEESASFEITFYDVHDTTLYKQMFTQYVIDDGGPVLIGGSGGMKTTNAGAITKIRFLSSSGNIEAGIFTLYGRAI